MKLNVVAIFLCLIVAAPVSLAQVYKWVDAEGNVHFSDNPQDAERGESVDVDSSNVMEGGRDLAASASRNRERVAENQRKAAEAAQEAAKQGDPCAEDLDRYRAYSRVHNDKNGVPYYVYKNNEDGSPMSQREHNQMVEDLRASLVARGCM